MEVDSVARDCVSADLIRSAFKFWNRDGLKRE
jgi:hypothetical protein